tara:strand:- start:205 stop:660 length:456 start_codon:yes stop_codon:yes gene_type:complete
MSDQSIKTKIQGDLIQFMKAGEKDKVDIIRFALSFINTEEKDKQKSLTDSETLQVLKKVIKRNQESFEQFSKASRNDLAEKEKKEMEIIKQYLPEEISENEIIEAVKKSITQCDANSIKDMGRVMAEIKKNYGDSVDMSIVSKHVKILLNS